MDTKKANDIDVYAGMKIRMGRSALGITQVALAKRLGVTFQQIQKYEKGTNRVGASRLHALAAILQVPIMFFFEEIPKEQTHIRGMSREDADRIFEFVTSKKGRRLNLAFQTITDPRVRRGILDMVDALASPED